jgi:hypothetical protein
MSRRPLPHPPMASFCLYLYKDVQLGLPTLQLWLPALVVRKLDGDCWRIKLTLPVPNVFLSEYVPRESMIDVPSGAVQIVSLEELIQSLPKSQEVEDSLGPGFHWVILKAWDHCKSMVLRTPEYEQYRRLLPQHLRPPMFHLPQEDEFEEVEVEEDEAEVEEDEVEEEKEEEEEGVQESLGGGDDDSTVIYKHEITCAVCGHVWEPRTFPIPGQIYRLTNPSLCKRVRIHFNKRLDHSDDYLPTPFRRVYESHDPSMVIKEDGSYNWKIYKAESRSLAAKKSASKHRTTNKNKRIKQTKMTNKTIRALRKPAK